MNRIEETYNKLVALYRQETNNYTNLLRATPTTKRDKELSTIRENLLDLVESIGTVMEQGHFPYGREVAYLLYTIPDYDPPCWKLQQAGKGVALALRTGQLSLTLENTEVINGKDTPVKQEKEGK